MDFEIYSRKFEYTDRPRYHIPLENLICGNLLFNYSASSAILYVASALASAFFPTLIAQMYSEKDERRFDHFSNMDFTPLVAERSRSIKGPRGKGLNPFPNSAPLQGFRDYAFTFKP
jgi:hypothetical protein